MITAVSHAETAAPLAALLPTRRGRAWQVEPAPYCIRPNGAMSRLTNEGRALVIVESAGVVEVFGHAPDDFAVTPEIVVSADTPDLVATLAARIMRSVLPRMERETATGTTFVHGQAQVLADKGADTVEIGWALINHGAHPEAFPRGAGHGLEWTTPSGAQWGVWALNAAGNLTVTYEGPLAALSGALTALLPSEEGHVPTDVGSVFTRALTNGFPQLRPVTDHEVEFGGYGGDVRGFIALPSTDEPADVVDSSRQVAAQFDRVGTDLLLAAVPLLV